MKRTASIVPRDPRLDAQIDAILAARHSDPFALLVPHQVGGQWTVRFFLPGAADTCVSLTPPPIEGGTPAPSKVTDPVKLRPEAFLHPPCPSHQSSPPTPALSTLLRHPHF